MTRSQESIDEGNQGFWDELCGSTLAQRIGITDTSADSLQRFDSAYFDFYPYLRRHLAPVLRRKGRTLEIGLGYGTVGGDLAAAGIDYHGLDIAAGPVAMMRERLSRLGVPEAESRVREGSALEIPWPDGEFDAAVSIGCLHHTGDLPGSIREVHRVLKPGGIAVIMLYNRYSLRRVVLGLLGAARGGDRASAIRRVYDRNTAGAAAPFTEFVSAAQARRLLAQFKHVSVVRENMDGVRRLGLPRERLLGRPARLVGLDLYITAIK